MSIVVSHLNQAKSRVSTNNKTSDFVEKKRRFLRSQLLFELVSSCDSEHVSVALARQALEVNMKNTESADCEKLKLFNLDPNSDIVSSGQEDGSISNMLQSQLDAIVERLALIANVKSISSVKKQVLQLTDLRAKSRVLQFDILSLLRAHAQIIGSCLNMLSELIGKMKLSAETERVAMFQQYFASIVVNMKLKLDLIRSETLLSLYTPKVLTSLQHVKSAFSQDSSGLNQQLSKLERQLSSFSHLCKCSAEFASIVTEYELTLASIETVSNNLRMLATNNE